MAAEVTARLVREVLHDDPALPVPPLLKTPSAAAWETLVRSLLGWGVLPLFYAALHKKGLAPAVPGAVQQRLRLLYHANSVQSMRLFAEQLPPLLSGFHRAGIPVMALKGVHLAAHVYAEPGLRSMCDVDLLLPAAALPDATTIMQRQGYTAAAKPHDCHATFRSAPQALPVEVHWRLQPAESAGQLDMAAVWQRAGDATIAGAPLLVPAAEDLLIYLCWHAAKHYYKTGLRALCDVRAVLDHFGDALDWTAVAARSRSWKMDQPTFLTLLLVQETLGTAVPHRALQRLQPHEYRPQWRPWAHAAIFQRQRLPLSTNLAEIWTEKNWQRRLQLLRRVLFPPATVMHHAYGAPKHPIWRHLYYYRRWGDLWRRYRGTVWRWLRQDASLSGRATLMQQMRSWK